MFLIARKSIATTASLARQLTSVRIDLIFVTVYPYPSIGKVYDMNILLHLLLSTSKLLPQLLVIFGTFTKSKGRVLFNHVAVSV